MSFRNALLATAMLALPFAAQAQPVTGLYVAGGAGVNWRSSTSDTLNGLVFQPSGAIIRDGNRLHVEYDMGWVVLGSIGWGFGNGLRAEVEGSYRTNRVGNASWDYFGTVPGPLTSTSGSVATTAVMANLFYDFRLGPVMPYLGGGIGYGWLNFDNVSGEVNSIAPGDRVRVSGSQGQFAYQGIVGLAIPIGAVPGLAITAEYRYFATQDARISGQLQQVSRGLGTASYTVRASNENQSLLLGVRYNFGRAPAPAPVAAAPAPATSFIVFFDFNRHDLTARAREIVAQAATAARSQQVTRIEVAGHTDTVGSAQYNLGLSQRRANTVAAELVRLGVPREAIQTAGYGFSRPLVATGPNVREPQNRRVEIVFR